ncbi:hypothetical protein [Cyclobacterium sp. 1_MG-2023]|uniref:hypothetical protein n=1 Tax=Cyclobacterium sp. 1_MG-2023 TaxID=3062681 RepID=UPI0026E2A8AE|nr:hypothetical protein [Cyclobacterium sp. 1_MG-2023]
MPDVILEIEKQLDLKANLNLLPLLSGDVVKTCVEAIKTKEKNLGYKPDTQLSYGVTLFVDWIRNYYKV